MFVDPASNVCNHTLAQRRNAVIPSIGCHGEQCHDSQESQKVLIQYGAVGTETEIDNPPKRLADGQHCARSHDKRNERRNDAYTVGGEEFKDMGEHANAVALRPLIENRFPAHLGTVRLAANLNRVCLHAFSGADPNISHAPTQCSRVPERVVSDRIQLAAEHLCAI